MGSCCSLCAGKKVRDPDAEAQRLADEAWRLAELQKEQDVIDEYIHRVNKKQSAYNEGIGTLKGDEKLCDLLGIFIHPTHTHADDGSILEGGANLLGHLPTNALSPLELRGYIPEGIGEKQLCIQVGSELKYGLRIDNNLNMFIDEEKLGEHRINNSTSLALNR